MDNRYTNESTIESVQRRRKEKNNKELTEQQIEEVFNENDSNVDKIINEPAPDKISEIENYQNDEEEIVEKKKSNALSYVLVGVGGVALGTLLVLGLKNHGKIYKIDNTTKKNIKSETESVSGLDILSHLRKKGIVFKSDDPNYVKRYEDKQTIENVTGNVDPDKLVIKDGETYDNQESANKADNAKTQEIHADELGGLTLSNGQYLIGGSLFESRDLYARFIKGEASLEEKNGVYCEYVEEDELGVINPDGTYTISDGTWSTTFESKEVYEEIRDSETPVEIEMINGVICKLRSKSK